MTRSWSAFRRSEWSRIEKSAWEWCRSVNCPIYANKRRGGGADLRVDKDAQRPGRGMHRRDINHGQRAGEMDVGVLVGHDVGGG